MIKDLASGGGAYEPIPFAPPQPFDFALSWLPKARAAAIERAIRSGAAPEVHAYIGGGHVWVVRSSLQELCAPGHCTYDETDSCCYIPD